MSQSLDVEIILNNSSVIQNKKKTIEMVQKYLDNILVRPNSVITLDQKDSSKLQNYVKSIIIGEIENYNKSFVDWNILKVNWYAYGLDSEGPLEHVEEDGDEGQITISTQLSLPSACLLNMWESLYYDNNIKKNLLNYAKTMMEFSDKGVDNNIISCNRVILLHGPPGTGKTSLCKALAQKLTIKLWERFHSGVLIEINSHSLFSKWFSESGKLVNKMFNRINDFVENKDILVCVLIDEVESLAHARIQCLSGTEPSDSIRVVNALLTQIDKIKRHSNVLIFATSNITESIDLAFVDRADIKQYLGNPSLQAIYKIYHSCINELIKVNVIQDRVLEPIENVINEISSFAETKQLLELCQKSLGLSGRSLRKIPFLAHALFIQDSHITLEKFLNAMDKAIDKEISERKYFEDLKVKK